MLALACGPSVSSSEQVGAGGGSAGDSSSGATLSSSTGSPGPSSSSGSSSSSSSTGEPPLEGPGCGEPPPCDRGTFEGHALIESEADLAQFEGYTKVTGFLQIAGSEDLVCLDRLACLEVVGRDVRIQQNAALESTAGLRNVRDIGARAGNSTIYVAENDALETLAGFAAEAAVNHLVLWRNPLLSDLVDFEVGWLRYLTALENPRLAGLTSLRELEELRCFVHRNPRLCSAEIEAVCSRGDPDYVDQSHIYYGAECAGDPAPPVDHGYPSRECSIQVEDCPDGEKCMPRSSTKLVCTPLVAEPREVGEACEILDNVGSEDNCGPRSICRGGACIPMAFGDEDSLVCPSLDQFPSTDADGVELFCLPLCDPLAGCGPGRVCVPLGPRGFTCGTPIVESLQDAGEPCKGLGQCAAGLACVASDSGAGCGGEKLCCGELCDMTAPSCAGGRECVSWWEDDDRPLPKVEHVGLCVDP